MIEGSPGDIEAAAARLTLQKGARANREARYQLQLAERRFYASLAKTTKELEALEYWVSMTKRLEQGEVSVPSAASVRPR